jgi:hypothetical protein
MTHETREQLEDAVFDAYPTLGMDVIESLSTEELRHLLSKGETAKPEQVEEPKQPKQSAIKPTIERIEPQAVEDAFTVVNGRLMRRVTVRQTVGQFIGESVQLEPVGERVRFAGRIYRVSHLLHWFKTGEWVKRVSKTEKVQRYRARVRTSNGLVHLGYFASQSDRDAAVFAYKMGIRETT